jgi:hypothetical protein
MENNDCRVCRTTRPERTCKACGTVKARFTAEPYTYQGSTAPAYFYVWDTRYNAQVGRNHPTREAAQAAAVVRNSK